MLSPTTIFILNKKSKPFFVSALLIFFVEKTNSKLETKNCKTYLPKCTIKTEISAGETPLIRLACPSVIG